MLKIEFCCFQSASINPRLNSPLVARSGRDIMQFALNAARLNLQPADDEDDEEEEEEDAPPPAAKAAKDLTPSELRAAIGHYFSPANRIIHGDSFAINGRRTRLDGTVEYLIEWDKPVNL
jgi:Polycomb-like MTF2 factor 2